MKKYIKTAIHEIHKPIILLPVSLAYGYLHGA